MAVQSTSTKLFPEYKREYFGRRTPPDCPSQMKDNMLISNSKLTSDSTVCIIQWKIVVGEYSNSNNAKMLEFFAITSVLGWLTKCTFGEKIARASISQFQVIKILLQIQMFFIQLNLDQINTFLSLNHSQSFRKLPYLWRNTSFAATNARPNIIW